MNNPPPRRSIGWALIGPGEFQSTEADLNTWRLRYAFLQKVELLEPAAIREFEESVGPAFRAAIDPVLDFLAHLDIIESSPDHISAPWFIASWRSEVRLPDQEASADGLGSQPPITPWPLDRSTGPVQIWVNTGGRYKRDTPTKEQDLTPITSAVSEHDKGQVRESIQRMTRTMLDWAERHRLAEEWVLDLLLGRLSDQVNQPSGPLSWSLRYPGAGVSRWNKEISLPAMLWNPLLERRSKARDRMMDELTRRLDSALDAIEREAEAEGLERVRKKRPRTFKRDTKRGDPYLHLEWLIRYQVQSWTYEQIAEKYSGRTVQTIYYACRKMADEIGLKKRGRHGYRSPLLL